MTVDSLTRAWPARVTVQLTVLAAAAFVYVTAEIVPMGALPLGLTAMIATSGALVVVALTCVALTRGLFIVPSATSEK
jgi:hypothetical protein